MDPRVFGLVQNADTGNDLLKQGLDSSPTSGWGALGRLAQTLAGSYLTGNATSDLAKAITGGRKQAQDDLTAAIGGGSGASPAAAAPAPSSVTSTQPRGIRNNNPLNIEDGPFTRSLPGYAGSDGRFAKFETPEQGAAAASKLVDVYGQKHGLNTVAGIVGRWAPASDGNNVSAYAADVSGQMGVDPNAPLTPEQRPALIAAMGRHENGQPIQGAGAAPTKVAQADEPVIDTHRLMAVLQNPYADDATKQIAQKLILQKLTKEDEFASGSQGIYNKRTGDIKSPAPKEDEFVSTPQGPMNKRTGEYKQNPQQAAFGGLEGPELLAAVKQQNPALAAQTQAVLEGRVPYPSGSRLNPTQQQLKELVTQIDPNFTSATSKVMQDTLQDYGIKGRTGQARQAANTMLGHADTLDKLVDKLGNYSYFPEYANAAHNFVAGNTDPEYQKTRGQFEETKKALATEAEKALAGHTTLAGIKEHVENLQRSKSPEELHAAIGALVHILGSRLDSMSSAFDSSMKTRTNGYEFLDPRGKEIFQRFEGANTPASADMGRIPGLKEGADVHAGPEAHAPAEGAAVKPSTAPQAGEKKPSGKTSSGISWSVQ